MKTHLCSSPSRPRSPLTPCPRAPLHPPTTHAYISEGVQYVFVQNILMSCHNTLVIINLVKNHPPKYCRCCCHLSLDQSKNVIYINVFRRERKQTYSLMKILVTVTHFLSESDTVLMFSSFVFFRSISLSRQSCC